MSALVKLGDADLKLQNYTALRAYTGRATAVRITASGVAGFFQRDDADVVTADNGGTVIVDASGRRWKRLFDGAVMAAWFGANGAADDTAKIQSAIDATPPFGHVVGDAQSTYVIGGRLNVNNRVLRDINFVYSTSGVDGSKLVLSGSARLINARITIGSTTHPYLRPLCGVVNLHMGTGIVIDNLEITDAGGDDVRVGIFCSTAASNTVIKNCRMNYIGWPILYNDTDYNNANVRTVDGVTYTESIGKGLYVSHCELGASDKTKVGDALEINCPAQRFNTLVVTGCIVLKTNMTEGNGLGIAAANVDNVQFLGNTVANVASFAGGLHVEKTTNALIANNTCIDCAKGFGAGIDGQDLLVIGNTFSGCDEGASVMGSAANFANVDFRDNMFLNCASFPIVATNSVSLSITGNTFKNVLTNASAAAITLIQTGALAMAEVEIKYNKFYKTTGQDFLLIGGSGTISEIFSEGNKFHSIAGNNIANYFDFVRSRGLVKDHYRSAGATSGQQVTLTTTPQGYLNGSAGDFATDVNAGVLYRHDGTNWVSKIS